MLHKLRNRAADQKGFTLIELLVVILIIGILAAIAIPSFLNQREKAEDADAKSQARTAQTAMETFLTDSASPNGYSGANGPALVNIESSLTDATDLAVTAGTDSYTVSVGSTTGNTFAISRASSGSITRTCDDQGTAGCGASWGADYVAPAPAL